MRIWTTQPPVGTPINKNHSLSRDLINCWLLNDKGGQIAFDSVGNGNGVCANTTIFETKQKGESLSFGSSTPQCSIAQPKSIYQPSSMTIAGSFYVTSLAINRTILFVPRVSGANSIGYDMRVESTGKLFGYIQTFGVGTFGVGGNTTISLNTWYHGVFTHDGVQQKGQLFLNGRADSVLTAQNNPDFGVVSQPTIGPTIGRYNDGSTLTESFSGNLKDVMWWNRVLTETEIMELYRNPYQIFKRYD